MSKSKQKAPNRVVIVRAASHFNPAFFAKLVRGFDAEIEMVRSMTLDNDEDQATSAERLIEVKRLIKAIEEKYESEARSHLDALAQLRKLIKPYKDRATALYGAWSSLLSAYEIHKAERASAALAIAREAAATRDHETAAEAVNVAKQLEAAPVHGAAGGSASFKVHWEVADVDMSQLPDEYVLRTPDLDKLNAIADATDETAEPMAVPGVVWRRATTQRVGTK